jgi:metal-dependent HD superfamily phosphatase/phosphodiesterase
MVTFEDIKKSKEISAYITKGNDLLGVMGYTDHGFAHAEIVARKAAEILRGLDYPDRTVELSMMAGYLHDIGNCVNRRDHAQSGAIIAFRILDKMGLGAVEVAEVVSAIGNHDEDTGTAVSPVSAALILADKSDVRRSRVRYKNMTSVKLSEDIHDRVNYAAYKSALKLNDAKTGIILQLEIDTEISAVMEYFEIFLTRMLMCLNAAAFLDLSFELNINNIKLL